MNKLNTNPVEKELLVEAIDLGDFETLEETITPMTGCGCGSNCSGN